MNELLGFLGNTVSRATSRSFVVSVVVIWFVATHPELTVEQIVGLLAGAGLVNFRAIAEDVKEVKTPTPLGDANED